VPVLEVERHMGAFTRDREIILYCACPNEASAAQAARLLMNNGFSRVRPLYGGLAAWIAAGYASRTSRSRARLCLSDRRADHRNSHAGVLQRLVTLG